MKARKCTFGQKIEYLGLVVTHQGVKVDNAKINVMVSWPRPTNISHLRNFLRLIGFYRNFVQNYRILSCPLTKLLKKCQLGWDDEAKVYFLTLKNAMTTIPTLDMLNFN